MKTLLDKLQEHTGRKMEYFIYGVILIVSLFKGGSALQCQQGEFPFFIPKGNIILTTSNPGSTGSPVTRTSIDNVSGCQQQCQALTDFSCVGFSYAAVSRTCTLYPFKSGATDTSSTVQPGTRYYEGLCNESPNLENCDSTSDKVDLVFLIDGSGSICDDDPTKNDTNEIDRCANWIQMKDFIIRITNFLTIGQDDTRVSLIVFSSSGEVEGDLRKYQSGQELRTAITNLRHPGGNTNTHQGLRLMRTEVYNTAFGDRSDVINLAIVITDGIPTINVDMTEPEAQAAQDEGTIMFSVGITNKTDEAWLKIFSSSPREKGLNYFTSPNFDTLSDIIASLLGAACIQLDPVFSTTTTTTSTQETTTTTKSDGDNELSPETVLQFIYDYPEYVAMIGMGIMILLLFITAIAILCRYSGASRRDEDYMEKN